MEINNAFDIFKNLDVEDLESIQADIQNENRNVDVNIVIVENEISGEGNYEKETDDDDSLNNNIEQDFLDYEIDDQNYINDIL